MPQLSKLLRSRDDWRDKAVVKSTENREYRKAEKRHKERIIELKKQNEYLRKLVEELKREQLPTAPVIEITQAREVRTLCIFLVIEAVVSYRSIPRILDLFRAKTALELAWVPHFTSVINWTLRLGLGLLKQVRSISQAWLAIVDHSIDIGTKKVLVVLRVSLDALATRGAAIQLQDCECIGLIVCEQVNGESIAVDLDKIFTQAGKPLAIISDGDYTLQKGIRLFTKKQAAAIPAIEDIGHVMANALKSEFEKTAPYKRFTAVITQGANFLRQTDMAFLIPPKLRSKGRFQSISTLGKWGAKMLDVFATKGRAQKGSLLARLRTALPGFLLLKPFIQRFARTTKVVSQVMEVLKNTGLNQTSYEQCHQLAQELPKNSKVKKRLQAWLQKHLKFQKQLLGPELPLLVSSDIIESLFGNFKHIIARSPQADMNRTTLLIPALCGNLNEITITQALSKARHNDLNDWEKENIPYTVRKKRQAFFGKNESHKPGIFNSK